MTRESVTQSNTLKVRSKTQLMGKMIEINFGAPTSSSNRGLKAELDQHERCLVIALIQIIQLERGDSIHC